MKGMVNYDEFYRLKQADVGSLNNAVSVPNAKKNIFLNAVNLYRSVGGGWK